jgi:hypothetical protein
MMESGSQNIPRQSVNLDPRENCTLGQKRNGERQLRSVVGNYIFFDVPDSMEMNVRLFIPWSSRDSNIEWRAMMAGPP